MSSDSDLTDLDDDDVPLSSLMSKDKGKNGTEGYKIKGALKAARTTTYTTQALYDQLYSGDIDLNADYQRGVVWQDPKQIGLVDSVFRNFYIPPLIFVVKYSDDGSERRICIDGKQRLTSIHRFMDGLIPYKDAYTGERFVFKETGKTKGRVLPERYRKIFRNKQIVCVEYQDLTNDDEREIFQRVQMGMALTPAEKLQAICSPAANFIRELQNQYVADELAETLDWETARASDFRGLAAAVFNMDKWPTLATMASLSQVEKWLRQPEELDRRFQEQVHATFHIFTLLARDTQLRRAFRLSGVKKVSPVEFMAITLLIFVHKSKLTLAQLSEAIATMRRDIRAAEVDIRMNTRVMKPMLAFIKDLKPARLTPDPGQPVAMKIGSLKRKRSANAEDDDDDDDDDADAAPAPRRPPPLQLTASQVHQPLPESSSSRPPSAPGRRDSASSHRSATPVSARGAPTLPIPDRLAAIKAAKDHPPSPVLPSPTGPASLRIPPSPFRGANHPMHSPTLPSPSPLQQQHPYLTPPYPTTHASLPPPPLPPLPPLPPARFDSLGDSLMARMMASPRQPPPSPHQQQQGWAGRPPQPLGTPVPHGYAGRGQWQGYR